VLTDEQLQELDRTGLLRLPAAFATADAREMEEAIWRWLGRSGVDRDDPGTWPTGSPPGVSPAMKRKEVFQRSWSDALVSTVDQLLDGDWERPPNAGLVMVTFPNVATWHVPHLIWHADTHLGHDTTGPRFGVKLFTFVNQVRPGHAGTCILSGSHHLIADLQAGLHEEVRADRTRCAKATEVALKRHPWMKRLADPDEPDRERFLEPSVVDGHELRVVELTGEPGDVVLIHPYALHTIAENAGTGPRMMTSRNLYRRGVAQNLPKPPKVPRRVAAGAGQRESTSTVTTAL
jgi:hypothetical protein